MVASTTGSPPQVWGTHDVDHRVQRLVGITPAFAGKARGTTPRPNSPWDHPRECGEDQEGHDTFELMKGSLPCSRVIPPRPAFEGPALGITPAFAGNTRCGPWRRTCTWDHPRIRGEGQDGVRKAPSAGGSPPHSRGRLCLRSISAGSRRITPAFAGKAPPSL